MIYLVEDDTNIRELVTYTLNHSGLDATGFERPSQFWKAMEQKLPDLVLLDIMLPEEDGLSILRRLRAAPATASIPILLVSAKNSEYDKVMGLDNGADDYLAKPFGMMELVARTKALLRRTTKRTAGEECRLGMLDVQALGDGGRGGSDPDQQGVLPAHLSAAKPRTGAHTGSAA